jgi:hypothetical protein
MSEIASGPYPQQKTIDSHWSLPTISSAGSAATSGKILWRP